MNMTEVYKLIEKYAQCPKCGCNVIGNGKGTLEVDTEKGYFKRTCSCGWVVTVDEGEE